MADVPGTLYVVATPIGNLADISQRATRILAEVSLILAEDTRHTGRLLKNLGVNTPMQSFHEHNERDRTGTILELLRAGQDVALVSDAGTPVISDPGYLLLRELHSESLPVAVIPGPCALVAALSISGLPTDSFVFEGFIPEKKTAREKHLRSLQYERRTMVFYEAPHRIAGFIDSAMSVFGTDRQGMIGRELTKKFEQVRSGTLAGLSDWLKTCADHRRGEFVVVIAGAEDTQQADADVIRVLQLLLARMSLKDSAKLASELTGRSKKEVYNIALELQQSSHKG